MKYIENALVNIPSEEILNHLKDDITIFTNYITYRAECTLFQLVNESLEELNDSPMPWGEFIDFLSKSSPFIELTKESIKRAVSDFPSERFDFSDRTNNTPPAKAPDDTITIVLLFQGEAAISLTRQFVLTTKKAYYEALYRSKPAYSWEAFEKELSSDFGMIRKLYSAFLKALAALDYTPYFNDPKLLEALQ